MHDEGAAKLPSQTPPTTYRFLPIIIPTKLPHYPLRLCIKIAASYSPLPTPNPGISEPKMPVDVAGAALGAGFGEILKIMEYVVIKTIEFKPLFEQLQLTLNQITPVFEDIDRLNRILDSHPDENKMFADKLEQGKKLVLKCAKVKSWNLYHKPLYAKKLIEFDKSLVRFFQIDVTAQISRDSKRTLETVMRIDSRLEMNGFGGVCDGKGGLVGYCGAPEFKGDVGLEEPVREVKKMVVTSGGQKVVVVSAPGGCGKTTLAKKVCHDPDVTSMFKENIFFVTASKTPNLSSMIEKLFQHRGVPVPKFQTDEDAINQLEHMLKQIGPKPILLVLDDVWSGLDSFIDRLSIQIPEIKILITSRSVFPRFKSTNYKLKPLTDKDAMDLFRRSAFAPDRSSFIPDDLVDKLSSPIRDDLVDKIVKGCGGFPLALVVVGQSLCGKPKEIWNLTLKQWSKGESKFSSASDDGILSRLLTSVDSLGEMYKKCYLDLASFPEDQRIPAQALIDMWLELYDLDEDEEEAIAILHELCMRSLIDLVVTRNDASEISCYYNEHFATLHDLLRELAIDQCCQESIDKRKRLIMEIDGNGLPKWWLKQQQHSICARLVSISTDESFSSNWHDMQLPEVEVLVLNIKSRNYTLPQFMENMNQLKVLIITNYSFSSSTIQSISRLGSLSSLKRIRFEHVVISCIKDSILKLRNLQKVSFIMCEISEAFRECTIRIPNMLPNLSEIVIDCCSDLVEFPAFLCEIISLKKLSITTCHNLVTISVEFGKLENLEVLRLHDCSKLLVLPDNFGRLKKLEYLDISLCVCMTKLPEKMGDLCGLTEIHMRGCQVYSQLPLSVKDLQKLKKVTCDVETGSLWQQFKDYLDNLEIDVRKEDINLLWL